MRRVSDLEIACFSYNSPKHAQCHLSATSVPPPCHPGCIPLGCSPCAHQKLPILAALPGISHPLPDFQKLLGLPQRTERGGTVARGVTAPTAHSGCSFFGQRVLGEEGFWQNLWIRARGIR